MPQPMPASLPILDVKACDEPRWAQLTYKRGRALSLSQNEIAVLVETYAERLVRYAFRLLGNFQDAEDVVQDVFVRTFSNRSGYERISSIGPYLCRSVANASTDLLRKRNLAQVFREEVDAEKLFSAIDGPAEAVQAAEGLSRAEAWLHRLPKEQAQAIRLRVFDGLSLNEIAEVLDCPVNTICSRLRYGFQKLRALVAVKQEP
jgi:RNA polymerase sigma-70 factor, ECF subfamily